MLSARRPAPAEQIELRDTAINRSVALNNSSCFRTTQPLWGRLLRTHVGAVLWEQVKTKLPFLHAPVPLGKIRERCCTMIEHVLNFRRTLWWCSPWCWTYNPHVVCYSNCATCKGNMKRHVGLCLLTSAQTEKWKKYSLFDQTLCSNDKQSVPWR